MKISKSVLGVALTVALAGCASVPVGPTINVMPGPGKPFDQFNADNAVCREYASQQLGANPNEVARNQVLTGALAGATLGAVSGEIMGHGRSGAPQSMAGIGLLMGSAVGAGAAGESSDNLQHRYNLAYAQCMYSKGNQVPGYGYAAPAQYSLPPPPPPPPRP
ncbi:MAG: hypothetical protein ACYC9L_15720 [Sulfuricaulis sp.]